MFSLFDPEKGLSFAEVKELKEPACFDDLNLPEYVKIILEEPDNAELRPYFYYMPKTRAAAEFRQSVAKDLCDPDIRGAVNRFILGIDVSRRYQMLSEKTESVQKWKWRLDTIVQYYDSIELFCEALNSTPPKSQALYDLHKYLFEIISRKDVVSLRTQAKEINDEFEKMEFRITIGKDRSCLDFEYSDYDYCNEIRSEFLRNEGAEETHSFTESPFVDMMVSPLEQFILEQFMKRNRVLFRNLETFCGINRDIISDDITDLIREFKFYTLNLDYLARMKVKNYPITFPKLSEDREVYLDNCYDIVLAEKNSNEFKEVVLNDIMKTDEETAIIVTGPNQGGKTTLARAFGQAAYLTGMGLPVGANVARMPFFDNIFTLFASMTGSTVEGRLEHELGLVKELLGNVTKHSLVIFNELFTSASTVDALSMMRDLLSRLIASGAVCFVVSHTFELAYDSDLYVSLVATVVQDGSFRRTYRLIRKPADGVAYANSIVGKYKLDYEHIRTRLSNKR
ncbi:MAG: hypothetical protein J5643_00780 [Lachnospiraceae bacterium]|nr:hypothetical protein [Lachnospiraceae bacterium]